MSASLTAARWLITVATLAYGVGPLVTDMNRTHLLHPDWSGHARFHLVWASVAQLILAGIMLALLWRTDADRVASSRLAAIVGLGQTAGFWCALALRRFYRGALHDPQGIPPLGGKLDGNLLAVGVITLLLGCALYLTF